MNGRKQVCNRCYGLEEAVIGTFYVCPTCDAKKPTPVKKSAKYICGTCDGMGYYSIDAVAAGQGCVRLVPGRLMAEVCSGFLFMSLDG